MSEGSALKLQKKRIPSFFIPGIGLISSHTTFTMLESNIKFQWKVRFLDNQKDPLEFVNNNSAISLSLASIWRLFQFDSINFTFKQVLLNASCYVYSKLAYIPLSTKHGNLNKKYANMSSLLRVLELLTLINSLALHCKHEEALFKFKCQIHSRHSSKIFG